MLIDPVLDYIEKRIKDTQWSYVEIELLNYDQQAAVNELIQTALTDTRKHFENAVIGLEE